MSRVSPTRPSKRRVHIVLVLDTVDPRCRGWMCDVAATLLQQRFLFPSAAETTSSAGSTGAQAQANVQKTLELPAPPSNAALTATQSVATHPPRPALADHNRVFLLLFTLYPAILGTMLWQFIERPGNIVVWLASLLLVIHFSLDLLYLKLNTDAAYYRYTWVLFAIDVALVVLMRAAFTTAPKLASFTTAWASPPVFFVGIYVLYVVWEIVYRHANPIVKRSSSATPMHYLGFCGYFAVSALLYNVHAHLGGPRWVTPIAVGAYLVGLCGACLEHYWSVFIGITSREDYGDVPTALAQQCANSAPTIGVGGVRTA
jgi:hypothetical protein